MASQDRKAEQPTVFLLYSRSEYGFSKTLEETDYTSIDPKQFRNDSFRPVLVKHRFLGTPYRDPKSKLFHQRIFVGIGIAICSATLLFSRATDTSQRVQGRGQDKNKRRTRPGQEEDKAQP